MRSALQDTLHGAAILRRGKTACLIKPFAPRLSQCGDDEIFTRRKRRLELRERFREHGAPHTAPPPWLRYENIVKIAEHRAVAQRAQHADHLPVCHGAQRQA